MTSKRRLKKSNKTKLGLVFLAFVAGIIIVGRMWFAAKNSQWSGRTDFSWVQSKHDEVVVETIIPEYSKRIIWRIPGNTIVRAASGYGEYQLKNVFSLGEIDSRGEEVLSQTLQNNLGLAVYSNLTWWDRLRIVWWQKFKIKDSLRINLVDEPVLEPGTLADGSPVWYLVDQKIDQLVNATTFSEKISQENLTLSLIGSHDLGRVISNHGIELVSSVSRDPETETTLIYVKNEGLLKSATLTWLKTVLPRAEMKVEAVPGYWSDLVLVLGKDYN
jgi:hypothetical protein